MKTNPLDSTLRDLNQCGCCAGTEAETPAAIANRPGLPAVAFRAGTHAQFTASLRAALSDAARPQLGKLRTREDDDFTMALLDGFSAMADVLTFYSERIANENFLRTATERRSVRELARAIGYELNPGVAASTWLAFTVEDAPGTPGQAIIPRGAKVQSVPGPEEQPQTFETSHEFAARADWNEFHLRTSQPQVLPGDQDQLNALGEIYLRGTTTNLHVGDVIVISVKKNDDPSAVVVAAKQISAVTSDRERDLAWIKLSEPEANVAIQPAPTLTYLLPVVRARSIATSKSISDQIKERYISPGSAIGSEFSRAALHYSGLDAEMVTAHAAQKPQPAPLPPSLGVFALRSRAGFFGHSAPRWKSLPPDDRDHPDQSRAGYIKDWDNPSTTIWRDSQGGKLGVGVDVHLERIVSAIVAEDWVVFDTATKRLVPFRVGGVIEESVADYAMSGKCTGLRLHNFQGNALSESDADKATAFFNRTTTAYVQSERLELAELPITTNPGPTDAELALDRLDLNLRIGQLLLLTGERADLRGVQAAERLVIQDLRHGDGITILTLRDPLENSYVRESVRIFANVVEATHGESVQEVVGNGEATRAHQQFALRQKPLTYAFPPGGDGAESSLQLWVNDSRWKQVESLYAQSPQARVFVARQQDDGTTVILFGDGGQGARLPSGFENIRANYRKGIGAAGLVKAGQLTLLVTRPLGVKAVSNPLKPTGAQDPETLAGARSRAPLGTLTLDRVVSLQDYEDFARAFAGVAKAYAVWAWTPRGRAAALTVIGPAGAEIKPTGQPADALLAALQNQGDELVEVKSFS
ncbi:MAG: hypothetical protein EPO07_05015, partial [Verrucomicrobia bacterium]